MGAQKTCFVIGPIGEVGSEARRLADWLLKGIIKPVLEAEPHNFLVTRADECPDPGSITDQIITAVMESDLVVADLTSHNPNAFYELAIRHMAEKPVVHMIMKGQSIPFDTKDYRTIIYDLAEVDDLDAARRALAEQVEAISRRDYRVSNPVTKARGHQALAASSDSRDQLIAQALSTLEGIDGRLAAVEANPALLTKGQRLARALSEHPTRLGHFSTMPLDQDHPRQPRRLFNFSPDKTDERS